MKSQNILKFNEINMHSDFVLFIRSLGNLHDCAIETFQWNPSIQKIILRIEDIYANFLDLPEYPGKFSGDFIFSNVNFLDFNIDFKNEKKLKIYDVILSCDDLNFLEIKFSPQGKIIFKFIEVDYYKSKT